MSLKSCKHSYVVMIYYLQCGILYIKKVTVLVSYGQSLVYNNPRNIKPKVVEIKSNRFILYTYYCCSEPTSYDFFLKHCKY